MTQEVRNGCVSLVSMALAFAWILAVATQPFAAQFPLVGAVAAFGGAVLILLAGGLLVQYLTARADQK